ncbi:hypothetical protein NHX12_002259 [Muraenolepis orangiensis]|uniref:Inner centromere protein ARK-binding domain-containing protein n=1 Tax=Muraenolepis orangiensis TaxID=630683 RepID=A0A9Q0DVV5_9TELE|nr:hypothetical protein NHX12_002259 [Muraenolepis orangiensis]
MTSTFSFVQSLKELFDGKLQQFMSDIDNVHTVWLNEIQPEANRMLTSDFSAEIELMPKTPSQKKRNRRKRVSLGYQEETRAKRRFSKGKRGNLRGSSAKSLDIIVENESIPQASTSEELTEQPKRSTRINKKPQPEVPVEAAAVSDCRAEQVPREDTEVVDMVMETAITHTEIKIGRAEPQECFSSTTPSPPNLPTPKVSVRISSTDRRSAELVAALGHEATKIAIACTPTRAERSSVRHSLKLRNSLAGLRHSKKQNTSRRASRSFVMKKKSVCTGNSSGSAVIAPSVVLSPALPSQFRDTLSGSAKEASLRSLGSNGGKRKSPDMQDSPTKKCSPPQKTKMIRPHVRSFLQTVQKNQALMTPKSVGRSAVMKSFIKHTTPLKIDSKAKERLKLEALKKKQEQEEETMKKMEEEKKQKQDERKRKRDERLRRAVESRMKEDEEKKKRLEQKMSQTDEKNDKRIAEGKTKRKVAVKRQQEVDQKRGLEEEARLKKIQEAEEEEEQQQLELAAKRAAEEEERARKLAEARRAVELRRELEREKELERERQAAVERERAEREKALTLQRELERAAREKERRELDEKMRLEERKMREQQQQRLAAEQAARETKAAKQKMAAASVALNNVQSSVFKTPVGKGAALNVTVEVEKSPQSYKITPKGGNKPLIKNTNAEDYGMDQNSDDSTDDESAPRKPIPSWAEGQNLQQVIMKQYFNPPDLHSYYGTVEPPNLEDIFYKSKPRYFKRTSSAVWHSPPRHGHY